MRDEKPDFLICIFSPFTLLTSALIPTCSKDFLFSIPQAFSTGIRNHVGSELGIAGFVFLMQSFH
jgi:hypothetical protein